MTALYSHTTRSTGTVLTAAIYNADHQNHIDNGIPAQLDDYSVNVTEMRATTDPGEVGTESQPTSLAGELERLRYAIADLKKSAQWYESPVGWSRKNAVINGGFDVSQRGTSFTAATTPANSDDTYLLDRWTLLSDGNDIVDVTQNTATIPSGGLYSCALDVETANKKFGIIQFIEQKNCKGFIGKTCTLSFKARKGASNATVTTMRAVILAWDGTADAVTSDVVSAWGASGTNPTLAANWTAENTAANLTLTDSFQTFSVSAAIDTASAKNIAVFLYYNNADGTVADFIYITDVQLEAGGVATEFDQRSIGSEYDLCARYFYKPPASISWPGIGGAQIGASWNFPARMRASPSIDSTGSTWAGATQNSDGVQMTSDVGVGITLASTSSFSAEL